MTIRFANSFVKQYRKLPANVRQRVDHTIELMEQNIHHPSLKVRKMVNHRHIYEGRVDLHYRVTFEMDNQRVVLRKVGTHAIYQDP